MNCNKEIQKTITEINTKISLQKSQISKTHEKIASKINTKFSSSVQSLKLKSKEISKKNQVLLKLKKENEEVAVILSRAWTEKSQKFEELNETIASLLFDLSLL